MKKFAELLKPEKYQVFLFTCPANIPLFFAVHPWFVVNRMGALSRFAVGSDTVGSRWEVLFKTGQGHISWGHLHKNLFPPTHGIAMFPFSTKFFWKGKLYAYIEGAEGSVAHAMADFIELSAEKYPYTNTYSLTGPNSNTYVQWVLDHFPESKIKLPWNSFGKNFKQ